MLLSYDWQNGSIPLVEDWRDWRNAGTLFFYTSLAAALVYSWLNRKVSNCCASFPYSSHSALHQSVL